MHLLRIDLNLLVVFDTVFAAGSITAASRKLNLSQPAVSHALARLRDVFGEPLFERQGRGIVPTPFARSIAGPVREALSAMERTFGQAAGFEPASAERHVRIGLREARPASSRNGPGRRRIRRCTRRAAAGRGARAARTRADRPPGRDCAQGPSTAATHEAQRLEPGRLPRARARAGIVAPPRPLAGRRCTAVARQVLERDTNQIVGLPLEGINLETYMYWPANAASDAANRWLRDQVRTALRNRR
jgi:DNA-binding transcriptional LysR family regulator